MASIFSSLVRKVGIDIGTSTTSVYADGRGFVMSEPTIVVTDTKQTSILAVGHEAELLLHRSPEMVEAITPLKDGVIMDYRVTRTMIEHFIRKSIGKRIRRMHVLVAVPVGITDVEKRALTDAILQMGARVVNLVESPVVAALGENMPIFESIGNMVVDIGAGSTDVAVMAMGGKVRGRTERIGGKDMNYLLGKYIRDTFNVMVSNQIIESIKLKLASAIMLEDDIEFVFTGRDLSNGLTQQMVIRASEVYEVIQEPIYKIIELIKTVLEQVPPELCADIMNTGILLTGDVAQMHGLKERLSVELGVPVNVPDDPGKAVVRGFANAFREEGRMDRLIISSRNRKGK